MVSNCRLRPTIKGVLKTPPARHCEVAAGDRGNLIRCARQTVEIATTTFGGLAMTFVRTFSTSPKWWATRQTRGYSCEQPRPTMSADSNLRN